MSESEEALAVRMDPGGNAGVFCKRHKAQDTRRKEGPGFKIQEERKDRRLVMIHVLFYLIHLPGFDSYRKLFKLCCEMPEHRRFFNYS